MNEHTIRIDAMRGDDAGTIEIDISDEKKREDLMRRVIRQVITPLEEEGWQVTWTRQDRPVGPDFFQPSVK